MGAEVVDSFERIEESGLREETTGADIGVSGGTGDERCGGSGGHDLNFDKKRDSRVSHEVK